jgi:hypothetical protein
MAQLKGTYLENYLESVATLPAEIRRNFALMRELDVRSQELIEKIEKCTKTFIQNGKRAAKETKELGDEKSIKKIRSDLKTCLEYGDEKVALAVQTYEMVDKHIRRLDTDLKKFESELDIEDKKKIAAGGGPSVGKTPLKDKGKGRAKPEPSESPQPLPAVATPSPSQKRKSETPQSALPVNDARVLNVDIDMPIDPYEPTYCICNRVSFGEMVGCDNPECKVEWFHFECVGLTHPPKGKWFCPECTAIRKKQFYK